jgi:hypothetical protein
MTKARKLADLIDANGDVTVANLDNVTADAISSGTLSSDRLPTVPITKGGTGSTTLGTAGQYLKVNSGATGVEYATLTVPTPDWNTLANKPTNVSAFTNDSNYTANGITGASGSGSGFGNINQGYLTSASLSKSGNNASLSVGSACNCNCDG